MVSKLRAERISNRIHRELMELLRWEVADPRLEGAYVTDVVVDRELACAQIYVSVPEGDERWKEVFAALKHARGFLRKQLAARIPLRTFPQLRFHWDGTPQRAERIEALIASLHTTDDALTSLDVEGELDEEEQRR